MKFLDIYANLIRIVLLILTIYYIYKRNFKLIKSTITVFALSFLLIFLELVFNIKIDLLGGILYFTIIFMAIYLGSALKFYDKYAWWDILIHLFSGVTFVSFGIALSSKINGLGKFNILFFSLTFSVTLHVLWEIAEYSTDCILHTNHQRWQKWHNSNNHVSKSAIQPAGLVDTMNDTICCVLSTIIACAVWWFVL